MIDPTLAELTHAALTDWRACGPLGDWYEERGHAESAHAARIGHVIGALVIVGQEPEFDRWLDDRDPDRSYRESRSFPPRPHA